MNSNTLESTIARTAGKGRLNGRLWAAVRRHTAETLRQAKRWSLVVPLATLIAAAIVVAAAWAVSAHSAPGVVQALVWAAGFVFLALAVESTRPSCICLLATGLALPVLAILSSRVAVEFAIVAAVLVGVWCGAGVMRLAAARSR